jgi:predicted  nucleic acid-binding Zn-ribbon protein
LNEQLKLLIELQELDTAIESITDNMELLPRKLAQFEDPLKASRALSESIKKKAETLNKRKHAKDLELDDVQDKIDKLKTRSSDIKTNKEYEAHRKEIEVFENNIHKIEDEILVLMEEIEAFTGEVQMEEEKVKKAEEDFKKQEKLIEEEKNRLIMDIDKVKAKRNDFATRIDKDIYDQYMQKVDRLGGLAVVQVKNEICLGCNTNIPPQLYNDIKETDRTYTCYFCKRFLYYLEPPPADENPQSATQPS